MKKIHILLLTTTLFVLSTYTFAIEKTESALIEKVIHAYGGTTLTNATSLAIDDYNKGPWPGESENPGLPEIWRINETLTIDFNNKRKSLLSYRVPRTTVDLEKWIVDENGGKIYDILHHKYSNEDWLNFNNLGASIVRSSDTLHAKRLHNEIKTASLLEAEYYRGQKHHKLAVTYQDGVQFTYYIHPISYLITKMLRPHANTSLVYVFSNHQQSEGVTFASDMNFFVNGALRLTSVHRSISLNPDLINAFSHYEQYTPWGEMIDNRELQAKQIAKGVYQAGKGRSKTVFIEQDDHLIALGSASEIKANYDAVKALSNDTKPIKYFIVTHHHKRNLRGLENIIAMGSKLVVSEAHKQTVIDAIKSNNAEKWLVSLEDRRPLSLGNITLYDIATAHSQHYLMPYLSQQKMVIAEEHFETQFKTEKPRIYKDMVIFNQALNALNLDVTTLIDIQSWRAITQVELDLWTQSFTPKHCPKGYQICEKG